MIYQIDQNTGRRLLFLNLVQSQINGDTRFQKVIDKVIKESRAVISDPSKIYKIDNDTFDIVLFLSDAAPEFFASNPQNEITIKDYEKVADILELKS